MKKLIVSLKSSSQFFDDMEDAFKKASKNKKFKKDPEISFNNKKDYDKFVKNMGILQVISASNPTSIYDLAKILHKEPNNLTKLINFFESIGALELISMVKNGRNVKVPKVRYKSIEFKLSA